MRTLPKRLITSSQPPLLVNFMYYKKRIEGFPNPTGLLNYKNYGSWLSKNYPIHA